MHGLDNRIALGDRRKPRAGANTALQLARAGADIVLTYRTNKAEGEEVVREIEAARSAGGRAPARRLQGGDLRVLPRRLRPNAPGDLAAGFVRLPGQQRWHRPRPAVRPGDDRSVRPADERPLPRDFFLTQTLAPFIAEGPDHLHLDRPDAVRHPRLRRLRVDEGSPRGVHQVPRQGARPAKDPGQHRRSRGDRDRLHEGGPRTPASRLPRVADRGLAASASRTTSAASWTFLCSEEGRWLNAQRVEASGGMFL